MRILIRTVKYRRKFSGLLQFAMCIIFVIQESNFAISCPVLLIWKIEQKTTIFSLDKKQEISTCLENKNLNIGHYKVV